MEPGGIEDHHAVRRGRDDPESTEISQRARDDLPDGSDGIGELLPRHVCLERAIRPLLRGREVEEVGSDALLHRAECVDRDLLRGLVVPAAISSAMA